MQKIAHGIPVTTGFGLRRAILLATVAWLGVGTPIGVTAALAAPTSESQRYYDEAVSLTKKNDLPAAIIQLKNAVRADAENSDARYELAVLYLRTGDPGAAQRELESLRARGYDENKVALPLGQAYFAQGLFREIIKNFDATKFTGDTRAGILVAQARAQISLQDNKAARALIDQALQENPTLPGALAADAILLRMDQKFPEAEAQIDKALAKDPEQGELMVLKGELRQQQQDVEGAMKYFDDAAKKFPKYTRARLARAMANLGRNKPDLISDDVNTVLVQEPQNPLALYLRAYLLSRDTKYKETAQILMALPQLLEGYPPARYLLAASAFADNQLEIALNNAQQYIAKVPEDVNGVKLLAAISQRMNNPAKAVELLEPLLPRYGDDNQLKLQLANAYLGVGRSEEAVKLFQQGVAADPNNPEARLALAVSQIRTGATDAGETELQKLLQKDPSSLQANALLVLTQLQTKQTDKAMQTADAMVKANPKDANAYNLKGTVGLASNDLAAARVAFKAALDRDPKFVAAPLNLARVEERANDLKAAKEWYTKALSIEPKNLTAFDGLANLALADKNLNEAAKNLEQSISLNPDNPQPRLRLIEILLSGKENSRALIAAREYATAMPTDPQAIDALGRAQIITGDFTNGIGTYQRLVTQYPNNAEAQRRLGRAFAASVADKKPEERKNLTAFSDARAAFDLAVAAAPDYQSALIDRISFERETNGNEAAVALAKKYVTERPDSVTRLVIAGDLETSLQKNDEALATYQKAWGKTQNSNILQRYYTAMIRSKKSDEGLKLLKDWVAKNPADYDVRFLITSAYINSGQYQLALNETESMNGVLPDNPVLLNNLAWLYGEANNPKAMQIAEKAYQLAPESPDVADTLGWLQASKGDAAKGATILSKAHELAPDRPEISYHYAAALKKSGGDAAKAKETVRKALESKANFAERKEAEALLKELGG